MTFGSKKAFEKSVYYVTQYTICSTGLCNVFMTIPILCRFPVSVCQVVKRRI